MIRARARTLGPKLAGGHAGLTLGRDSVGTVLIAQSGREMPEEQAALAKDKPQSERSMIQ